MRRRLGRRHREGGASAVEFALVMPVLFLLLFGIIDYGLLFFDSIGLRQGAREGARQAVVQKYNGACTTGTPGDKIACTTKKATDLTIGSATVRVVAPDGWVQGKQLIVCTQSKEQSLTGYVPFPSTGIIKTKTAMSIEEAATPIVAGYTTDAAPAGGDWTWCN
jgi:Flp pilus assembly protein TadG